MSGKLRLPAHLVPLNPHLAASREPLTLGDVQRSKYKSNLERRVATEWIPTQGVRDWKYEPLIFKLAGGNYTPDFMLLWGHGTTRIAFVECKGWTKSLRADRRAFKEAANTHTWAEWLWLTWDKTEGWREDWFRNG